MTQLLGTIPYTHWAYFTDEAAAKACGAELSERFDCLIDVELGERVDDKPYLLLAARPVGIGELPERHDEVQIVVQKHGGSYDFGESGWLPAGWRQA
ncbi:MAG TPA: hypothetical protein VJT49_10555 [Amycolatopsis sp.]|uniref:hypothetical protein n=1 Tax=Amycolatopsis sp. TaxID=37632 RepID=UPI002B4A9F85|nr:hypothetical protein [Amycolatopsis sp.]HKS45535.1 hypothetical protein [Amycolatopsis sp.]